MTFQSNLFAGKVALVTGATTGIGAGIAIALAELGAEVVAAGLGAGQVDVPAGLHMTPRELDVCDEAGIRSLIGGMKVLGKSRQFPVAFIAEAAVVAQRLSSVSHAHSIRGKMHIPSGQAAHPEQPTRSCPTPYNESSAMLSARCRSAFRPRHSHPSQRPARSHPE